MVVKLILIVFVLCPVGHEEMNKYNVDGLLLGLLQVKIERKMGCLSDSKLH